MLTPLTSVASTAQQRIFNSIRQGYSSLAGVPKERAADATVKNTKIAKPTHHR